MTLSRQLVDRIMSAPIIEDKDVLQIALQGITDFFACNLQAKNEPEIAKLQHWFKAEGGHPTSWLIGHKTFATARQAALLNGFQAHLLDYDDVHADVRGHPSAVILSALFASLKSDDTVRIDSRRFLTAYIIGIELMAHLGQAVNPYHYDKGWHSTATLGGLAGVAAICYLHQYDFLAQAFALAATQSGGLRLMFGTPIKPLHAGIAAQSAVQTVELLKAGLSANCDFLDPKTGFLAVYAQQNAQLNFSQWGMPWKIIQPGLWFKTYSYCSAAAYVADAATQLCARHAFNAQDIVQIELIFPAQTDTALIYKNPTIQQQGRFSAEYIVTKILLGEKLDFSAFSEQPVSSQVSELMAKCVRIYAENDPNNRYSTVKVRLKNGEFYQQQVYYPKGCPQNPYSNEELYQKLAAAIQNKALSAAFFQDIQLLTKGQNIFDFIKKYSHLL